LSSVTDRRPEEAAVILVPCTDGGSAGCLIVRRAVDLVAADTPELATAAPADCPKGPRQFVLAIDASSTCKASEALKECGARPSATVSAPEVLARKGLVRPGVDVRARVDQLAEALAEAIRESLVEVLEEVRERRRYREEMAPVMKRFQGIWGKAESLPPPNGVPEAKEQSAAELLAKRARNLFVRFDEVVPPSRWAEPHDLFQDALLCIAYASEGWAAGDGDRWEQNMEKARVQVKPLLRRLEA
jgi:hypothetical protein